jgi:hypothetical protein
MNLRFPRDGEIKRSVAMHAFVLLRINVNSSRRPLDQGVFIRRPVVVVVVVVVVIIIIIINSK